MHTPKEPLDFETEEAAADGQAAEPSGAGVPLEPADSAIQRLEQELADTKDRQLRLAAEFDNFRKRSARERLELADRAQAALLGKLLDVLDDLHRAVTSDPGSTQADALRQAINAIDAKLWKELGAAGLERIEAVGQPFDPTIHEAVSMMAAPSAELANTVAATLQSGYRYKGLLVRPARVAVYAGGAA
jgi:molecular chaperone GrpE